MASTGQIETFEYERLPDARTYIRLLEISSVKKRRDIRVHCKLTTWPKTAAPEYTAISYTWGDPNLAAAILVNGKRMSVRRNCEDVLRQPCRHRGGTGYFWIDAICIDQADNDEKGSQVAGMGDVYRDAGQTLACVGRHGDDSEFLFERLRTHRRWWELVGPCWKRISRLEAHLWRVSLPESTMARLLDALGMFLERPYFRRVWIYQELFFGRNIRVWCGDKSVEMFVLWGLYKTFCSDRMWLHYSHVLFAGGETINGMARFEFLLEAGIHQPEQSSLWGVLYHVVGMLQSEDPRDRVYGTLAMVHWEGRKPIQPDYGKDRFDLAVEVLRTIGHFDPSDVHFLSNTIMAAHLLELPAQPPRRLTDGIKDRRSKTFETPPPVDLERMAQAAGPESRLFWGIRLCFHDESWQIQPLHTSDDPDQRASKLQSPASLTDDGPFTIIEKWSKGHLWDLSNKGILLPQEVEPQNYVLLLPAGIRFDEHYGAHVALLGRDIGDGQLQVVGKALVAIWQDWGIRTSAWERGSHKYGLHLDPEDAIVLACSCNWKSMVVGPLSVEDEGHKARVDDYFETRLCGERSYSYAKPVSYVGYI